MNTATATPTVQWTERYATITDPSSTRHCKGDRMPLSDAMDAACGWCVHGFSFESSMCEVLWESDRDADGRIGQTRLIDRYPAEHIGFAL